MTPFELTKDFFELLTASVGFGLGAGIICSYIFKLIKKWHLPISSIKETVLILGIGYISYYLADRLKMSGILTIIVYGVICA